MELFFLMDPGPCIVKMMRVRYQLGSPLHWGQGYTVDREIFVVNKFSLVPYDDEN